MTRFEALVSLNMSLDVGSLRLNKLLEFFGEPGNILTAPCEKLMAVAGIGEKIASNIRSFKKEDLDRELSLAKKSGLRIITLEDKDYPENLKNIPDPPLVLYIKGELKEEDKFAIAIVGSRRASFYGLSIAEKFAFELAERGFTVISGMARGIDTYAHRGALKQGKRTIAVMGSGFGHLYPEENKALAEEIARHGAVLSEFPIDAMPLRQNFPRRNRVISGLSLGVLVVEAARNSGALITADFALEQAREVFALPGKVDSRNSFGTHELIKQGAKLVSGVQDILEEFNLTLPTPRNQDALAASLDEPGGSRKQTQKLSADESLLYSIISNQSIPLDEIIEKTDFNVPKVTEILLNLQLKRLIKELPGKQFIRN